MLNLNLENIYLEINSFLLLFKPKLLNQIKIQKFMHIYVQKLQSKILELNNNKMVGCFQNIKFHNMSKNRSKIRVI
jgi:hypothetical protein